MTEYSEQAAAARREYQRKWRAEHKDKISEYSRKYWERRAEAELKAAKGRRKAN